VENFSVLNSALGGGGSSYFLDSFVFLAASVPPNPTLAANKEFPFIHRTELDIA